VASKNSYTPNLGETVTKFEKPKRDVSVVFIHCTATSNPNFEAEECHDLHVDSNGWSAIGYHYLICTSGEIQYGRDVGEVPAAQSGYNTGSIAISLNGLDVSDFNQKQLDALRWLCNEIDVAYSGIRFRGHCEVAAKACPVFDYHAELGLDAGGYMTGSTAPGKPPSQPGEPPKATIPMVAVTCNFAQLGVGDNHPHVAWVRGLLGIPQPTPPDYNFTAWLDEQIIEFQQGEGLTPDGIVGAATWQRLLDVGDD